MRTTFSLIFYPWDFSGGAGALLDRALGEVGFDALVVPAVSGGTERFRIEPDQPPHTFATEGGWHFPTRADAYQACAVKPRTARWSGKRDVLEKLQKYAGERGLEIILEVNPRGVGGLLEHEPHLRGRDAWGDVNTALGACVMNADLRELLHATLTDLTRYSPVGFQLVNWMIDLPAEDFAPTAFAWHATLPRLMNICFCPACRQLATVEGVDPDAAAETVRQLAAQLMQEPEREVAVCPTGNLKSYLEARRHDVGRWLARLREMFPEQRFHMRTGAWTPTDSWLQGEGAFEAVLDGYMPVFVTSSAGAEVSAGQREGHAKIPPAGVERYGEILPVWRPEIQQGDELVKRAATAVHGEGVGEGGAVRTGATMLEFEGLDTAPRMVLDWVRHAVRYARRG